MVGVFEVESTLVQLRHWLVGILQHDLLVYLPYHLFTQPVPAVISTALLSRDVPNILFGLNSRSNSVFVFG